MWKCNSRSVALKIRTTSYPDNIVIEPVNIIIVQTLWQVIKQLKFDVIYMCFIEYSKWSDNIYIHRYIRFTVCRV